MHSVACSGSSIKNLLVVSIKISLYTPRMSLSFIGFSIISRLLQYSVFKVQFVVIFGRKWRQHTCFSKLRLLSWFSLENDDSNLSKRVASCELYLCVYHSLVETERFELLTPCLQGRCSPNWATPPWIWQPPALPYRLQYSTIGRLRLNHRVRDENGCVP